MTETSRADEKSGTSIRQTRRHQLFPVLNEAQFELLSRYGERRSFHAGDILFREGERHISMFVILSGAVDILRDSVNGQRLITTHGPGVFTGEVGTLAGRAAIVTGRAAQESEVIVIDEPALRTLVITEAELSETIMRAFILRRVALIEEENGGLVLIGSRQSSDTLRLREFMTRNGQPVAYFDIDQHIETNGLLERFSISRAEIPAIVFPQGNVLRNPTNRELADAIGLSPERLEGKEYDLVVVGAGPAGLAAAVYAASEGLNVAVLDAKAPGGQAGASSKIENYFGFPTGVSGQALAGRGLSQARKFGAEVAVPVEVKRLECNGDRRFSVEVDNGERLKARAVMIATGARYRKLSLPNLGAFEGRGVYYGASFMESTLCARQEVVVVGGGNSAGQAAVFLSGYANHVHMLIRGKGLAASMSRYLIQRIEASANITLRTETEIVELIGDDALERIRWRHRDAPPEECPVAHVFLFLGADPNTSWLNNCVALDDKGFVLTGPDVPRHRWPLERMPHSLETSRPGIFAVGDVRSSSVKRVAAAVGEGAAAVQSLHAILAASSS